MTVYAAIVDLEARYPHELTLLAADEETGLRDDARVTLALQDASAEVDAILQARYTSADLGQLDETSARVLSIYTMDIALYRIALAFSRSSERIEERYQASVKRLEAIAAGKGALTIVSAGTGAGAAAGAPIAQNEVVMIAPERRFTRDRLGGI